MDFKLHYNFRDVLWSPGRALAAKQIFVMSLFILIGLLVYDAFAFLSLLIEGERLSVILSVYGFFPIVRPLPSGLLPGLINGAGMLAGLLSLMLGFFGVMAINIEQIRGNQFLTARDAIRFAARRFKQIFLSELAIALFIGVIILLFFLLGLVSRIPFFGLWLYTLFFTIPNFIISLLSVFIILVLTLSVILLPAVAAAERKGETFAVILDTFSTIIRQPFRWFGYTVYTLVASKVCGFIFAYFCFRAVQFLIWSSSLSGGDQLQRLIRSGLSHLPVKSDLVRETCNLFPGIPFSFSFEPYLRGGGNEAVGYLMAVMLFLIFISILGYMLSVVAAGQAQTYVALRYIKDGYAIGDEPPLFGGESRENQQASIPETE
jgi:hypothetical protein